MIYLLIVISLFYLYKMLSPEQFIDIIQEQQRQIEFLLNNITTMQNQITKLENTTNKDNMNDHLSEIEKHILKKTEKSFKIPNLRSEYQQDFDFDKGIKYIIEKKQKFTISNIVNDEIGLILPKNATIVNSNVFYEIKFYVCSKIPNIPLIPIYDEYSRRTPEKSNIFNINDVSWRFVPKIFMEIKTETGDMDVIEVNVF